MNRKQIFSTLRKKYQNASWREMRFTRLSISLQFAFYKFPNEEKNVNRKQIFLTLIKKYQNASWREMMVTLDITDYQFLSNLRFTTFQMKKKYELQIDFFNA